MGRKQIKENMTEIMEEMKKALGDAWRVKTVTVNKVGGKKEGISCRLQGSSTETVIYPEDFRRMLESGKDSRAVGQEMARRIGQNKGTAINIQKTEEEFRKGLFIQMVNAQVNGELLEEAVYEPWDDMAAIARCRVVSSDGGEGSFVVTRENMGLFHMTQGEIMEQAYHNTAGQEFSVKSMEDVMRELLDVEKLPNGMTEQLFPEEAVQMYVLTNKEKVGGANVLVCPEVLHGVYEELGEPFYVLPSSTHEVLLIKESAGVHPEDLRQMVHDVNVEQVKPEDLLSFQVFHYDGRRLSAVKEEVQSVEKAVEKAKKMIR